MQHFGLTPQGGARLFSLTDGHGHVARLTDYGARLVGLWVPGRDGRPEDIVLGHDSIKPYLTPPRTYFGATCGRYANRIAGGRFVLDGVAHQLDRNEGANHLHGGAGGFDVQLWQVVEANDAALTLALRSPDGDMGYPGALDVTVRYGFTAKATLDITMNARVTQRATILNLVNHAYFNLAGQGSGTIENQRLTIAADRYLPVDDALLPVGPPAQVDGTAYDFQTERAVGDHPYDHNLCLNRTSGPAVTAYDPASGRGLKLWTNQPGLQLYSGAYLPAGMEGKAGRSYGPLGGFTLETQLWPDTPNRPDYPAARLDVGTRYRHSMRYRFFVQA